VTDGLSLSEQVIILSKMMQQMNDRLMLLERTVNTMFLGGVPAPSKDDTSYQSLVNEINSQPPPKKDGQTVEVKHMMNSDGSQIFRFPMSDKSWIVIKLNPAGDISQCVRQFDNGETGELDMRDAEALMDTIRLNTRPPQAEPSLFPDTDV